jgi:hypothetical protein
LVVDRSKIFVVKIKSESDLSGSEMMIFGQEQGTEADAVEVTAGAEGRVITVDVGRAITTVVGAEVVDVVAVRGLTAAGEDGAAVVAAEAAGFDGAAAVVIGVFAAEGAAVVDAVVIGALPTIITPVTIVLPQTPQLSSTPALIV